MKNQFEELKIRVPRSVEATTLEDVVLSCLLYGVFSLYCFERVGFGVLFLSTLVYVIRAFTIRHEKSHMSFKELKGWVGWMTCYWTIYHTPYQEPFSEKRRKHLSHHGTHTRRGVSKSYSEDPHQLLEEGPLWRVLLSNVFYEEVMFAMDWKRNGGMKPDRMKMLFTSTIFLAFFIPLVGLANFFALWLCYRICMSMVWFLFSFVLHREPFYSELGSLLLNVTPQWAFKGTDWIFGSSNVTVVIFHQFHHENPNKFFQF